MIRQKILKHISNLILTTVIFSLFSLPVSSTNSDDTEKAPIENTIKVSILGDSISTFDGISSGDASFTSNSTIKDNRVFFMPDTNGVQLTDTWWYQAINEIGGELLVNNSYSRSSVYNPEDPVEINGYFTRCENLHDNTGDNSGEEPDIIIVYMGTNDYSYCKTTLGSFDEIDINTVVTEENGEYSYKAPENSCEAYFIMLHKISIRYPDAEVFCFNLTAKKTFKNNGEELLLDFNESLKKLTEHFNYICVDNYLDSGITSNIKNSEIFLSDGIHPNKYGMDTLTTSFLNSFYTKSRYANKDSVYHKIEYDLEDVLSSNGTLKIIPEGKPFDCTLLSAVGAPIDVSVYSGEDDITEAVYSDNIIKIPSVENDIKITAKEKETASISQYYFLNDNNIFKNIVDGEHSEIGLNELISENGIDKYYKLSSSVQLLPYKPWSVVWDGSCKGSDIAFYNYSSDSFESNTYIKYDKEAKRISIGEYKNGQNYDYGIDLTPYNIDTSVDHNFRLSNEMNDKAENTVTLYIDGKKIGQLNEFYLDGVKQEDDINGCKGCNGLSLYINFIGCENRGIYLNQLNHIKFYENIHNNTHTHETKYDIYYESTCTEDERTEYVCECGYTSTHIHSEALGHSPSKWITDKQPTRSEEGSAHQYCTKCNAIIETVVLPPLEVTVSAASKVLSFIEVLLVPLIIIIMGIILLKKAPKKKNSLIGYRTAHSMKNRRAWIYANKLMGKIWIVTGIVMASASTGVMIPCISKSETFINNAVLITNLVQIIIIILTIIPVEKKLKKKYSDNK